MAISVTKPVVRWAGPISVSDTITSAAFTPADNSLLVVCVNQDEGSGGNVTATVSGGGLSWTQQVEKDGSTTTGGHVSIWTAPVATGASMSITVGRTIPNSGTQYQGSATVYQVTGQDSTTPIGVSGTGNSTTNNITPTIYTGGATSGSYAFVCAVDWSQNGSPVSSDLTYDSGDYAGFISVMSGYKSVSSASPTANIDGGGTGAATWNWAALEIKAPAGSGTSVNLTGSSSTSGSGSITQTRTESMSGAAVTASAGTVTVSTGSNIVLALGGSVVTSSAGTISETISKSLSGQAVSSAIGTLNPRWQARVDWNDISGEDGYRIKWGTAPDTYTFSADVGANVTDYLITDLALGTTYYARIYGLVAGVEQNPSSEIILTQNDLPINLTGSTVAISSGTTVANRSKSFTGMAVTTSTASINETNSFNISGQDVVVSAGNITVSFAGDTVVGLIGQQITASAGNVTQAFSIVPTGQSVPTNMGSFAKGIDTSFIGSSISIGSGTITPSVGGDLSLSLGGQSVSVSSGSFVSQKIITFSGVSITSSSGTLTSPIAITLQNQLVQGRTGFLYSQGGQGTGSGHGDGRCGVPPVRVGIGLTL